MALHQRGRIWYADFYVQGQRVQESTGTANRREAERYLAKRTTEAGKGSPVKAVRISLEEFSRRYMDFAKANKRSWLRDQQMLKPLNSFFRPALLTDIGSLAIEHYKLQRSQAVSPATVNREIALLKRLYNLADNWRLFEGRNPVKGIKFLRENNQKLRVLSTDEETRLLAACPAYLGDLVSFAIHTGLRSGDIYRLQWENINYETRQINVHIRKTDTTLDIPFNDVVLAILEKWAAIKQGPYVFFNQLTGDRFYDLKASLKKALKEAKLTGITWHTFRHTFASRLCRKSVDIVTVKELMGHASIRMTMRYAHTNNAAKREAVESLSDKTVTVLAPAKKA